MNWLLGIGLTNALVSAVLAAAAAAFGATCRRPALVHALWLIVLFKLLTPPLWNVRIDRLLPARPDGSSGGFEMAMAATSGNDSSVEAPVQMSPLFEDDALVRPVERSPDLAPPPARRDGAWKGWAAVVLAVWGAGSLVCLIVIIVRIGRFCHLLRQSETASDELRMLALTSARRIGLSRVPEVCFVPGLVCPMLFGVVGRPRVLVPRGLWGRLSPPQRSSLLMHEMAHLKRRDHWVRRVELAVVVLYWWWPVAWWARGRLREAEEACCDAWVIWTLPGVGRAYAGAILEAVEFVSAGPALPPALASGMGQQFDQLRRRLTMITCERRISRTLPWYGRLAVAALGCALLPLAPSSRAQADDEERPATVAPVPPVDPVAPRVQVGEIDRIPLEDLEAKIRSKLDRVDLKVEKESKLDEKEAKQAAKERDQEVAEARAEVRELSRQLERATRRLAELEAKRHGWKGELAERPKESQPGAQPLQPQQLQQQNYREMAKKLAGNDAAMRARERRLSEIEQNLQSLLREVQSMRRDRERGGVKGPMPVPPTEKPAPGPKQ
ncbi:MAG TPA: M56 family metallopeptidase [Tepidisphaeraceae bacterium]|jgi:beta-lactamase regulating signal transducer with metallopeptidase domain